VRKRGAEKAFIAGGATIYRLGMKVADILDLTRLEREFEGDVRFPDIDANDWELCFAEPHEAIESRSQELIRFTYETYRRRARK
jgi:dihydrofolate reductase